MATKPIAQALSKYKVAYARAEDEEETLVIRDTYHSEGTSYCFGLKWIENIQVLANALVFLMQYFDSPGEYVSQAIFDLIKAEKIESFETETNTINTKKDEKIEVTSIRHNLDETQKSDAVFFHFLRNPTSPPQIRLSNYIDKTFKASIFLYDSEVINLLRYLVFRFDIVKYKHIFNSTDCETDNFF